MSCQIRSFLLRCDKNKNGVLNIEEIEDWLLKQINQHLDSAKNQNDNLFNLMDTDKNGRLSLRAISSIFIIKFLCQALYSGTNIMKYTIDFMVYQRMPKMFRKISKKVSI